jgi:hypothetical protein
MCPAGSASETPSLRGDAPKHQARRDLILGVAGLVVFLGLSALLMILFDPGRASPLDGVSSVTRDPIDITLMHTNDTRGFMYACG